MQLNKAIFYIKYYAKKHDCIIERKATLDEALDFAAKANCPINEAEIIRCNSTGLAIFNPQNCADYLESMKNKNISREDKILARLKYDKQSQQ